MQSPMQMLQGTWSELAGWALILSGLSLATWTLGEKRRPKLAPTSANRAQRPLRTAGHSSVRRIDPIDQWQRLVDIAGGGLPGIESIAASQDRAREEIAAADQLLSDCAAAFLPYEEMDIRQDRGRHLPPAPAPVPRPLAA